MSLMNDDQRTLFVDLLARALSSAGLAASLISICVSTLLPTFKPAVPLYTQTTKRAKSRPRSAPATVHEFKLDVHQLRNSPPNRSSTPIHVESIVQKRPSNHVRHVSFSLESTSLLSRTLSSTAQKVVPTHPAINSPSVIEGTPRSSLDSMSTSSSLFDEGLSRSGSFTSIESDVTPPNSRRTPLSSVVRLPSVKQAFNHRRRRSSDMSSGVESRESMISDSFTACPFKMLGSQSSPSCEASHSSRKSGAPFGSPWPISISRSRPTTSTTPTTASASPTLPPLKLSRAKNFTRRLSLRSSGPVSPVPRTQPYGAPYNAPMPEVANKHRRGESLKLSETHTSELSTVDSEKRDPGEEDCH